MKNPEDVAMCIYQIKHIASNKKYVGQTTRTIKARWADHCRTHSGCEKLSRAIKKYGKEAFEITVIEICETIDQLNEREVHWIKELNSITHGYNLNTGGRNFTMSEETKSKMSLSKKGKLHTPEHTKRISIALTGKPKSEKHRKNLATRTTTHEQRLHLSKINTGKMHSEESRKKMSDTLLSLRPADLTEDQIKSCDYYKKHSQIFRDNKRLGIKVLKVYKNDSVARERSKLATRRYRENKKFGIEVPKRVAMTREQRLLKDKIRAQEARDNKKLEKLRF